MSPKQSSKRAQQQAKTRTKRNRRQVLEDSMWSAALAVGGGGVGEAIADPISVAPSERLGVAVVGARGRGGSHIAAFAARRDTEILYVCDVDREVGERRVQEAGKRQRGRRPKYVEDFRWVLADPRVDVVSIATPNHWHALATIWALQAGKDVYVEKPVSHNVSEGRLMVEAARKYHRIVQSGLQARSNPGPQKAIEFIHKGGIGKVTHARGVCFKRRPGIGVSGNYPAPDTVNYRLWEGPAGHSQLTRSRFHHDWHWQWAYGNGELGNQCVHQMDMARWGLQIYQLCDNVISTGGRFGSFDAGETPNNQAVVYDFNEQSIAFEIRGLTSARHRHGKVGVMFQGSDGFVVLPSYQGGAAFDPEGNLLKEFRGKGDHFGNFVDSVKSRQMAMLNADIEEGHLSSALCHLGNLSYQLGEDHEPGEALQRASALDQQLANMLLRNVSQTEALGIAFPSIRVGAQLQIDRANESLLSHPESNHMLTREYSAAFSMPSLANL